MKRAGRSWGAPVFVLAAAAAWPAAAEPPAPGPIRAALAAFDTAPFDASAMADARPFEATTLCRPARCGDVIALPGVPRYGSRGPLLAGAAVGLAAGALLTRDAQPGGYRPLDRARAWDGVFVGGGLLAWASPGVIFRHGEPEPAGGCFSDCTRDGGDALNGVDAFFRRALAGAQARDRAALEPALRRRAVIARISDATLAASVAQPLGMLAMGGAPQRGRDAWVLAGSLALAGGLTNATKHVFHRPRPFAHYCEAPDGEALADDDAQLSFFSGHTSTAFAAATVYWRLARLRGYEHTGWIKGSGLALAAATGVLRIAADKHHFTDVVVGAVAGWAAGFVATKAHTPDDVPAPGAGAAPRPAPGGFALGFTWSF